MMPKTLRFDILLGDSPEAVKVSIPADILLKERKVGTLEDIHMVDGWWIASAKITDPEAIAFLKDEMEGKHCGDFTFTEVKKK